jgi:hypothetical protein
MADTACVSPLSVKASDAPRRDGVETIGAEQVYPTSMPLRDQREAVQEILKESQAARTPAGEEVFAGFLRNREASLRPFPAQTPAPELLRRLEKPQSFESYFDRLCRSSFSYYNPEFDIAEVMLVLARESSAEGFARPFDARTVLAELYKTANEIGQTLQQRHGLVGLSHLDISDLPDEKKKEIIRDFNRVFFSHFKTVRELGSRPGNPELGHPDTDTRTFAEVFEDKGGYCEDLGGVYISLVQILRRGGIDLPVVPVGGPGHFAVAWHDNAHDSAQRPLFFVELTAPGGALLDSTELYERNLEWDLSRIKNCLTALPCQAVVAAELDSRVNARIRRSAEHKDAKREEEARVEMSKANKDARMVTALEQKGAYFNNLAITETDPVKKVLALTQAINLQQSREHYLQRACAYEKVAAAAQPEGRVLMLLSAVRDCDEALKIPPNKRERASILEQTSDFTLKQVRDGLRWTLFRATGDAKHLGQG